MEDLLQRVPSASSPVVLLAQGSGGNSPRVHGIVLPTPHPGTEWLRSAIPERGTVLLKERRNWTSAQRRELVRSMQAAVEARNRMFQSEAGEQQQQHGSSRGAAQITPAAVAAHVGDDGTEALRIVTRKPEVLGLERSVLQRGVIRSDLMLPPSKPTVTLAHLLKHRRIAPQLHQQIVCDAGGEGIVRLLEDMALPLRHEQETSILDSTELRDEGHSGAAQLPWWPEHQQQQQQQQQRAHAAEVVTRGTVESTPSPTGLPRTKPSSSQGAARSIVPIPVSWTHGRTGTPELRVLPFDDLFQLAGLAHAPGSSSGRALDRQIRDDVDDDRNNDSPTVEITRSRDVGVPSSPTRTDRSIGLHYGELGESVRIAAPFASGLALLRLSPTSHDGGERRLAEASLVVEAPSPTHGGAFLNRSTALGTDGSPSPLPARRGGGGDAALRREGEASLPRQRLLLKKMEALITAGKEQIRPERLYEKHGGMAGREFTLSNASHCSGLGGGGVRSPDPVEVSAAEELVSLLTNRERRRRHLQGRRLLKPVHNQAAGLHAEHGPDTYNPIPEEERRRCDQAWLDNPDYWFLQEASIEGASNETKRLREQGSSARGRGANEGGRYGAMALETAPKAGLPHQVWSSPIVPAPGRTHSPDRAPLAEATPLKPSVALGATGVSGSSASPPPLDDITVEWTTSGPVLRSEAEMKHATVLREKQMIHERYEAIKRRDMAILRERQERLHHKDLTSAHRVPDRSDSFVCPPVGDRETLAVARTAVTPDDEGALAVKFSRDGEPQQGSRSGKTRLDVLSVPRCRPCGTKSPGGSAERPRASSFADYQAERQREAEIQAQQAAAVRTVAIPVFLNIKAFA